MIFRKGMLLFYRALHRGSRGGRGRNQSAKTPRSPKWYPEFVHVRLDDAQTEPASESLDFRIVSYNILAQLYVKSATSKLPPFLRWDIRSKAILSRLIAFNADFLCVQEMDEFERFYQAEMQNAGYDCVYIQREGRKRDGCGIFYKNKRCEILFRESIKYDDLVPADEKSDDTDTKVSGAKSYSDPRVRFKRNCVGVMAAFRFHQAPGQIILVANTHLHWDPGMEDVKLAQAKYLLWRIVKFEEEISGKFRRMPLTIVTGDFSSTPEDPVYKYLTSGCRRRYEELQPEDLLKDLRDAPIVLRSFYGTASTEGEPCFTYHTSTCRETSDYIFYSPSKLMREKGYVKLPKGGECELEGGIPNHFHPSDHLPIAADFTLYFDMDKTAYREWESWWDVESTTNQFRF